MCSSHIANTPVTLQLSSIIFLSVSICNIVRTLGKYISITAAVLDNYVSICSMFKSTLLTFDYKVFT